MIINKKWVNEKKACEDGAAWFNENYPSDVDGADVVEKLMTDETIKAIAEKHNNEMSLSWANWLIVRLMTRKQYLQYAVFAAEQVIHIYEQKYPVDKTVRACIDAAKSVIKDDTEENRNKADAARAAARSDAWAAAWDAAWDAASAAMIKKILSFGISLLRKSDESDS